jgi:hypothetical protein
MLRERRLQGAAEDTGKPSSREDRREAAAEGLKGQGEEIRMLSPLRNRFGIPGVISVIALVFAMFGGAYAATNGSGGGKATASAKGKAGPRGPRGKTGPAGPAGPAGPQGPAGANGKDGASGQNGAPGAKGKSVVLLNEAPGNCGIAGGFTYEVEGSGEENEVCNGEEGEEGPEGEPGAIHPGETLPHEATETGVWSTGFFSPGAVPPHENERILLPISFTVPLAAELDKSHVHFIKKNGKEVTGTGPFTEVTPTLCLGTAAAPSAVAGNLCVYGAKEDFSKTSSAFIGKPGETSFIVGASKAGATLGMVIEEEEATGWGTWAVTAP